MIILGQSILKMKSAPYVFEELKKYLLTNNKINDDWNAFNVLSNNASTVGSYDLELFSSKNGENETLKKVKKNEFEVIFLFGQENLKFNKKNEFIIYVGSHGDRGAEIADIILPSSAYTEQEGYFTNLEGRMQKAYSASYPPGEAKEDWQIINELAASLKRKNLFTNKDELVNSMINFLNMNKDKNFEVPKYEFINEKIFVDDLDYYHSNAIARASKTMSECKNLSSNIKKTGTDG
jgi:NADH dehydrogenase/NADH:ubiquinone oxidoreductase 75 kD subunit (chain G)